jgi:hypothetical protein
MANATPPDSRSRASGRGGSGAPVEKDAVEARQGRRGRRVLIILLASLVLLAIAYFVIHGYFWNVPHQSP